MSRTAGSVDQCGEGYRDEVVVRTLSGCAVTSCRWQALQRGERGAVRPEGTDDSGYRDADPGHGAQGWEEFTPFHVGDAPSGGEYSPQAAGNGVRYDGRARGWGQRDQSVERGRVPADSNGRAGHRRPGAWWTESSPTRLNSGDNVRSTRSIGSEFASHVPPGTSGRVVDRRTTWLGEDRLTIEFTNGYLERDVAPDAVERRGWLG